MKSPIVPRTLLACAVLSAFVSVSRSAVVTTPAEWDANVTGYYGANYIPLKTPGTLPDSDTYAWNGYHWISAYLALAQSTGSSTYMAKAKEMIDYMISKRDDIRFASTTMTPEYWSAPTYYLYYNGVPAKGWRRIINGKSHVSPLIDGRICESIILWCELARKGFPQYEGAIAGYLPKVRETLDMHMDAFLEVPASPTVPTGNIYTPTHAAWSFKYWQDESVSHPDPDPVTWSGFVPVNHDCTFARAMIGYNHLTGTTHYQDQVQQVVNYFLNSLDPAQPTKAVWMYSPLDGGVNLGKWEDVDHATVTLSLIEEAYRVGGYGITSAHIQRLVQTFHGFYNNSTKGVTYLINGTGSAEVDTWAHASIGAKSWLWLSQFDSTILDKVRAAYNQYFGDNSGSIMMCGWANLIYWESVEAGTAAIDDDSIGAPGGSDRPLYTDTVNLLKWPYVSNATWSEPTSGGYEGSKHSVINYTVSNYQWSFLQFSFSPAENATAWDALRLAYKTTGSAVFSLSLSDGTNTMTATLPAQGTYALRTLDWSDFANQAAVNKSALTSMRIIANGVASASGQISFDDVKFVEVAPSARILYTDAVSLIKWPSASNGTLTEPTSGGYEGSKHKVLSYSITNSQWSIAQHGFYPVEDAAAWSGLSLAYKTTGPAVFTVTLSDGTNTMTGSLPAQSSYAPRTLNWSDFTNQAAVNKSAITTIRIIANGVASGTGTVSFDDIMFVD